MKFILNSIQNHVTLQQSHVTMQLAFLVSFHSSGINPVFTLFIYIYMSFREDGLGERIWEETGITGCGRRRALR